MMRPFDGIKLAGAKLRAHRVRTGIITSIVAVMFSGIVLILCILAGTAQSLQNFGQEGLGGRYIVRAQPIIDRGFMYNASVQQITDKLTDEANTLKAAKKAEAKRLGIDYDATNDSMLPIQEVDMGKSGEKTKIINQASPIAQKAIDDYAKSLPHVGLADFTKIAEAGGATAVYKSSGGAQAYMGTPQSGVIAAIIDGKEASSTSQYGQPTGVGALAQGGWAYFDKDLLRPFVLPKQSLSVGADGSIPVVAPISAAEQFLGRTALPATATTKQQSDYLAQLRTDVAGKTAELCYRNTSSNDLLSQAKTQVEEIARNKNKRDYTPPALQYNVPTTACGEVTVKKDTRTSEEKKAAENQLSFKRQFESYEDPVQGIIKIRIVGIVPEMNYAAGFSVKDILKTMLQSGLGSGWFAPIGSVETGSLAARMSTPWDGTTPLSQSYYAEFPTYQAAKKFTESNVCNAQLSPQDMMQYSPNMPDPRVTKCMAVGKYFDIQPFGNNAGAIEDLRRNVWKVLKVVAPVVLFVASLVLMGIVGKIIADSRRETAVFRALGATRSSIAQIYLTYSVFIAASISIVAVLLGAFGAYLISQKLSPDLSVTAALAYNASDLNKQFTLFGIDWIYIAVVVGLIVLAALLSTVLPLLTNVRRNPIRDMRDE